MSDLARKTVVVTGGTGAIGSEVVRALLARGAAVTLLCRDSARGAALSRGQGAGRLTTYEVDLASVAAVRDVARRITGEQLAIDVVLCLAGVWSRQRRVSVDGHELTFAVNHLAPFVLVTELLSLLQQRRARVVTVASGLHARGAIAWDDLMQARGGFNGTRAYEQSKLANVMFALALARRAGAALTSVAMHPGVVRSALTREYPELWKRPVPSAIDASDAARAVMQVAFGPGEARMTGCYFDGRHRREAAPAALDRAAQERLWRVTEALVART